MKMSKVFVRKTLFYRQNYYNTAGGNLLPFALSILPNHKHNNFKLNPIILKLNIRLWPLQLRYEESTLSSTCQLLLLTRELWRGVQ